MRHQRHKRSLGVTVEHRKALLANLTVSLVTHNRITTTLARAKETSKLADKMVTLAKKNTLHARRQIIATLRSPAAARKLMDEFAPLFKERKGGYTRIYRHTRRIGDDAQLAILEFTEFPAIKEVKKPVKKKKEPKPKAPVEEVKKGEAAEAEKGSEKTGFFKSLKKFGKNKK